MVQLVLEVQQFLEAVRLQLVWQVRGMRRIRQQLVAKQWSKLHHHSRQQPALEQGPSRRTEREELTRPPRPPAFLKRSCKETQGQKKARLKNLCKDDPSPKSQ